MWGSPKALAGVRRRWRYFGGRKGSECCRHCMEEGRSERTAISIRMLRSMGSPAWHGDHAWPCHPAQHGGTPGTHRGWAAGIPHSWSSVSSRQTCCRTGASPRAGSTTRTPPAPRLQEDGGWVLGVPLCTGGPQRCFREHCALLPAVARVGGLQARSCQPSSKLVPRYTQRTPAPARLGDAVRSTLMVLSAGSEPSHGVAATPAAGGGSAPRSAPLLRR